MALTLNIEQFIAIDADPSGTAHRFTKYVAKMELLFTLVFRKSDGSPYAPADKEKNAMMLFRGGEDMMNLYKHVGKVKDNDSFETAIKKAKDALSKHTNSVVQRNLLLSRFSQGSTSFEKWSVEISNVAKLIDYKDYDLQTAVADAIALQTSNQKLHEKNLNDNLSYDEMMVVGVSKEQSEKVAFLLAGTSHTSRGYDTQEEVRRLQSENKKLKNRMQQYKQQSCQRCGYETCQNGNKCCWKDLFKVQETRPFCTSM